MMTDAEEVLFGGAYGGGKSTALRCYAVTYCLTYPGANVVLFRRTYRELEDTHIIDLQREVPLSLATYSSGSHTMFFDNGSVLQLRFCEKEGDELGYDTAEYDAMLLDELSHFSQIQYLRLIGRCRSTNSWWPGRRIRCAATPTGIGLTWVKERWRIPGEKQKPDGVRFVSPNTVWTAPAHEGGLTRIYIPARAVDNPYLMKVDPDYVNALKGLPTEEYRAKALGHWDVFSGQYFTRWQDDVHTLEPFDIPLDWDRFLCVDYGYNAPYAAIWFARPPKTRTAYVYREHYAKSIPSEEQIFQAWQVTTHHSEKLRAVILDPSMFNRVNVKGERIRSLADDWKSRFGAIVHKGNNDRLPGWRLMREMIEWEQSPVGTIMVPPRLQVFRSCENTIRTLPNLTVDTRIVEDIDSDGEDHCADALRYGLMFAFAGGGDSNNSRRYYETKGGIVVR